MSESSLHSRLPRAPTRPSAGQSGPGAQRVASVQCESLTSPALSSSGTSWRVTGATRGQRTGPTSRHVTAFAACAQRSSRGRDASRRLGTRFRRRAESPKRRLRLHPPSFRRQRSAERLSTAARRSPRRRHRPRRRRPLPRRRQPLLQLLRQRRRSAGPSLKRTRPRRGAPGRRQRRSRMSATDERSWRTDLR